MGRTFAQSGDEDLKKPDLKAKFEDSYLLTIDGFYAEALPVWLDILEKDPDNANVNYLAAVCYYHSPGKKLKGIDHFEKAIKRTTENYKANYEVDRAPIDAHFYLGELYHLAHRFDDAIEQFRAFREKASDSDHPLMEKVDRRIEMVFRAKEMVDRPLNVSIQNLGKEVNSAYDDYCIAINAKEDHMFFTSRRLRKDSSNFNDRVYENGRFLEDIYESRKKSSGGWEEARLLDFNTAEHDATCDLSPDGSTLYFYRDDRDNGSLYRVSREEGEWGEPIKLGGGVNDPNAFESHLSLSPGGDTLYFVSDREGGEGERDIYVAMKTEDGTWGNVENLGPTINTPYNEEGPFMHPDGKTLYFSSEGHESMGGYDIFFSEKRPDGTWSEPMNMRYPVNTPGDDVYFVTSDDGERAYYSSNLHEIQGEMFGDLASHGGSDLYMMQSPKVKEEKLALLQGVISNAAANDRVDRIAVRMQDTTRSGGGEKVYPQPWNGAFFSVLKPGRRYKISYEEDDTVFYSSNIMVPEEADYQTVQRALKLDSVHIKDDGTMASFPRGLDKTVDEVDEKQGLVYLSRHSEEERMTVHVPDDEEADQRVAMKGDEWESEALKEEKQKRKGKAEQAGEVSGGEKVAEAKEEGREEGGPGHTGEEKERGGGRPHGEKEKAEEDRYKVSTRSNIPGKTLFKAHFGYNKNRIDPSSEDFRKFTEKVAERIEQKGYVKLNIEGSASKVPTQTYDSNLILSSKRVENAKTIILETLKNMGYEEGAIRFDNLSTLVQGPNYSDDAQKKKDRYERFQYVRVTWKNG